MPPIGGFSLIEIHIFQMITYQTLTGEVVLNHRIVQKVIAFVHRITPDGEWFFTRSDTGRVHGFSDEEAWNARRELMLAQGYEVCDYIGDL